MMIRGRKKWLVCLALLLALPLTACGDGQAAQGSHGPAGQPQSIKDLPVLDKNGKLELRAWQTDEEEFIYYYGDGVFKAEAPLDRKSVERACSKFNALCQRLAADSAGIYCAIVPDKNYFLTEMELYPTMNYDTLYSIVETQFSAAQHIDLRPCLTLDDYYRTDPHWRQEKLMPVATVLGEAMGVTLGGQTERSAVSTEYCGVYGAASPFPVAAETMYVLSNDQIANYRVYNGETGEKIPLYDTQKLADRDPYEMFVGGPLSLVTIENPNAENDRHLVVFRDSFASALLPLLSEGYARVTAVDTRYISPVVVEGLIDCTDADVLFLFSTIVLNNAITLK